MLEEIRRARRHSLRHRRRRAQLPRGFHQSRDQRQRFARSQPPLSRKPWCRKRSPSSTPFWRRSRRPLFIVDLNQRTDRLNEAYHNGLKQLAETTGGAAFFSRSTTEIPEAIRKSFETVALALQPDAGLPERVPPRLQIRLTDAGRATARSAIARASCCAGGDTILPMPERAKAHKGIPLRLLLCSSAPSSAPGAVIFWQTASFPACRRATGRSRRGECRAPAPYRSVDTRPGRPRATAPGPFRAAFGAAAAARPPLPRCRPPPSSRPNGCASPSPRPPRKWTVCRPAFPISRDRWKPPPRTIAGFRPRPKT